VSVQATHLVNHLIASGTTWDRIYREARWKAFWAEHGTLQERWYTAIVSELRLRGTFVFLSFFWFSL
jgi:hypothetical protein